MPVFRIDDTGFFPPVDLAEPDGLLAVGDDLNPKLVLQAVSQGIFPWFNEGDPILWWSPDPRLVLFPTKLKVSKSLRKSIKGFKYKINKNFKVVIENCADVSRKEGPGTWITNEMKEVYIQLHKMGFAYSFETYLDNKLVGGLYGIKLGNAFFGESMFHLVTDASKAALFQLCEFAKAKELLFIDSQVTTTHMLSLGAEEIPRKNYLDLLEKAFGE